MSSIIFWILLANIFHKAACSPPSKLMKCKTITGHPGLCVADHLCRFRVMSLTPCLPNVPTSVCCPFPHNSTDRESDPVVFPEAASYGSIIPVPYNSLTKNTSEVVDIIYPSESSYHPSMGIPKPASHPPRPDTSTTPKTNLLSRGKARFTPPKTERQRDERSSSTERISEEVVTQSKTAPVSITKSPYGRPRVVAKTLPSHVDSGWTTAQTTSTSRVTSVPFGSVDTNDALEPACGKTPYTPLIAGGIESKQNQWPWMAAIFQRFSTARASKFICGGSLINARYVMTAAHCCVIHGTTVTLPASSFLVKLGSNSLSGGESFSVHRVKVHPDFSFVGQFNDIALLQLTTGLQAFTDRVFPVCLPQPGHQEDDLLDRLTTVVGWGTAYLGGETQDALHEVSVPVVSSEACRAAYSRHPSAAFLARGATHVICAGLMQGGKDSCKSDSGGPLMLPLDGGGRWAVEGIVSFGYRCAEPGFPGVYTRVSHYLTWIYDNAKH